MGTAWRRIERLSHLNLERRKAWAHASRRNARGCPHETRRTGQKLRARLPASNCTRIFSPDFMLRVVSNRSDDQMTSTRSGLDRTFRLDRKRIFLLLYASSSRVARRNQQQDHSQTGQPARQARHGASIAQAGCANARTQFHLRMVASVLPRMALGRARPHHIVPPAREIGRARRPIPERTDGPGGIA